MSRAHTPSANVAALEESATIAASARAKALRAAGRPVIDLGAGEPDFPTPAFVREAAVRALEAGATRYTAVEGLLSLREAIAARAGARYAGPDPIGPADVVVTAGTKQALFNACFVLFGPGDEVLVPTPGWTSYYQMITLARATPVPVRGARAEGLRVTPAALAAAATARTRGVILNSPVNPTGAVYGERELEAILALAEERGWWVVSDEIYRRIAYEAPAPSLLDVARRRDRLVVVDGVAKAYAMTGWRIGWAVAPRPVAASMTAFQSHTTSNASTPGQHAALAALRDTERADAAVATMVAEFRRRRDAALAVLGEEPSLAVVPPAGAFYLFVDVSAAAPGVAAPGSLVARRLLEEHEVAVVPGEAFRAPEWVRLSYAAPLEDVVTGARRLVGLVRAMRAAGDAPAGGPVRAALP